MKRCTSCTSTVRPIFRTLRDRLPDEAALGSGISQASQPLRVEPISGPRLIEPADRPLHAASGKRRSEDDATQDEDIEQMGEAHRGMPIFDGCPVFRKQMFIVIPAVLFDQEMFFHIPSMASHPIAPVEDVVGRDGRGREPDPALTVLLIPRLPGFFAHHLVDHRMPAVARYGILPRILKVIDPPEALAPIAPGVGALVLGQ